MLFCLKKSAWYSSVVVPVWMQTVAPSSSLADETPNVPILIGCEPRHSEEVEPWLSVTHEEDCTQVEETCTP